MICPRWFISCNKCTTLEWGGGVDNKGDVCVEEGDI